MRDIVQIQVLGPDRVRLEQTCRELVEARLIACGQVVGPVQSVYRWKGRIDEAQEWLALLMTTTDAFQRVAERLYARHPGELPEIIGIAAAHAFDDYAAWVRREVAV